ncbi:alanine racemase [Orbus sturtevantii]|uniref:alanine racemase n=1 Tax=Orbus sturtevantii TaxID=3074109 RepID=UPI00370D857C
MSIATIEISISGLLHNVAFFRNLSPNSKIMAIVKANAYSHGKEKIATLLDNHIDYFGVARLEEAIELREIGIKSPIVVLEGLFQHDDMQLLIDYDLQTVVHCSEQIEKLAQLSTPAALKVWFKLDSGMHRLGFRADSATQFFAKLVNCDSVKKPINILSHFSCADILTSHETLKQITVFDQFIDSITDPSLLGKQSLAASGGILAWHASHRDVIRPGIALYGVSPFDYNELNKATGCQLGLKPVMKLKSEIITVREHKKGESVGYGLIWQSSRNTKLGVVAMGYGDGYPRDISPGTQVWLNGRLVPIVGRVAMDMILIDLGPDSKEQAGTEVIFWGNDELPVEKIAAHSGMSPYELLTRLTKRAKLRYVD